MRRGAFLYANIIGSSFFLFVYFLLLCASATAESAVPVASRLDQTASGRGEEYVTELSEGWKFGGRGEDASVVLMEDYDDSLWKTVDIPHTWNIEDGADGNSQYERTAYWYRKKIRIDSSIENKRIYLEFLGVNQQTDLYVNGTHVKLCGSNEYRHKGGYTAFRYDITDALRNGSNLIAVRADNTKSEEIAPISGDFNIYGGIYRRVFMVAVDEIHVDLSNAGSSGLFLTTPNIRSKDRPDDFGTLNIRADVFNDGVRERTVTVTAHIEGDNAPADIQRMFTIPAHGKKTFDENAFISDPHLWQGIDYSGKTEDNDFGYMYTVSLTITDGEQLIDTISDRVGFRYIYVDRNTGFYLNGESYPLHGVNRHQFKEGLGSALSEQDHLNDIQLVMELGANSIRLCHYPQCDYIYDLCDENGIIVWTEIPLVNDVGISEEFLDVTKAQLTELIRQQYNRPSVCFWGLENEIGSNTRSPYCTAKELLSALDDLAHEEDGSGRYTTQAINVDKAMDARVPSVLLDDFQKTGWKSDLIGWNIYPGWYSSFRETYEEIIDNKSAKDSRPMCLSEYGWGASVEQHELYPALGENNLGPFTQWHPEEYQSLMHEQAIRTLTRYNYLWATYLWCMFDFDVDTRNEGSRAGQNDKGLVTNDRKIKKDSYYLYKANWNQRDSFVHITSSRYTERSDVQTYIKVYSNCDNVELEINGESLGNMIYTGNGIFIMENVRLRIGDSVIRAIGRRGQDICEDLCRWIRTASSSAKLESSSLFINNNASLIGLPNAFTLGKLKEELIATENASYKVIMPDGSEVNDDGVFIQLDMRVIVTAENCLNTKEYFFIPYNNIIAGKKIWATSCKNENCPEYLADNDTSTRWEAIDNSFPQSVTVDLGDRFFLNAVSINWYSAHGRQYAYSFEVSEDGINFLTVVECIENEASKTTYIDLKKIQGRYIRINVLSCANPLGCASMDSIWLDGWSISAREYELDYENQTIKISSQSVLSIEEFKSGFIVNGNCTINIESKDRNIDDGTLFILRELSGNKNTFIVLHEYSSSQYFANLVFQDTSISATSSEKGNAPEKILDGDDSTRWAASDDSYPQSITLDLGSVYHLNNISTYWSMKNGRHYSYTIEISEDGKNYAMTNDCSENTQSGVTCDDLHLQKGRYVRVNVLSCSDKQGYAGIKDITIDGWSMTNEADR